jgi:hypothetical protein
MTNTKTSNAPSTRGLRVKSRVKAGFHFVATQSKSSPNHNQTVRGLRIRTRIQAGSLNYGAIKF